MLDSLASVRLIDVVDLAFVVAFLWATIMWVRRTRARLALLGLGILGVVYLLARQLGLQLTAWLLERFFAVLVIVVVIVFQEDLRRFFEQIALWGLRRRPRTPPSGVVDTIVRTVTRLAATRMGALLVFPGGEPLDRHLEGGIRIDARVSEPLLLSLFDTHSPGHDGAVLVNGDRAEQFALHLPLSKDHAQLGPGGTRHAAALGLAERTDALCVVVSEERGTVSVAHRGQLRVLERADQLAGVLGVFLDELMPAPRAPRSLARRLGERWLETALAAGLAVLLWFALVPGSTVTEVTRRTPIVVENLPPGYVLESVEPAEVEVILSGRRRDVYLVTPGDVSVRLDALLAQLGRRTFELSPERVRHPESLEVLDVQPNRVKLSLRRETEAEKKKRPAERAASAGEASR